MIKGELIDVNKFSNSMLAVLEEELMALGMQVTGRIQKTIRDEGINATGHLMGSFAPFVSGHSVEGGVSVAVGSPLWAAYGEYVEFGTKPHWAPIQPLITWIREKHLNRAIGVEFSTGKARPSQRGTKRFKDGELESLAYAIRAKIAREGTKKKLFVAKALESMGLTFQESRAGGQIHYEVSVGQFLKERGVWGKIVARAKN